MAVDDDERTLNYALNGAFDDSVIILLWEKHAGKRIYSESNEIHDSDGGLIWYLAKDGFQTQHCIIFKDKLDVDIVKMASILSCEMNVECLFMPQIPIGDDDDRWILARPDGTVCTAIVSEKGYSDGYGYLTGSEMQLPCNYHDACNNP